MTRQPRLQWLELRSSAEDWLTLHNDSHVPGDRQVGIEDAAAHGLGLELCQRERRPSGGKHSIREPLPLLVLSHELFLAPNVPLDLPPESRGPLQRTHYDADDKKQADIVSRPNPHMQPDSRA
jgi:hypothetical protein